MVGADPQNGTGRGVVAACSYEARKFGIHSAMPISIAYKKCPDGIFLRPDMEKYCRSSRQIFGILEKFTPNIEPVSIDEAFMDITGSFHLFGTPHETCCMIKRSIKDETDLTASIGMAPNKMTAKIASDLGKPDGLVTVTENELLEFLHPLPVEKLWGIGEKTRLSLKNIGINSVGDLARRDISEIERIFGKNGCHVWQLANGIDSRRVEMFDSVKSISNEYTFDQDTADIHKIMDSLMFLSEKVSRRLRGSDLKGKTVSLKIRFGNFKTCTRSITLDTSTNFVDTIYENVLQKTKTFDLNKNKVRLVGVKVSNLTDRSFDTDMFEDDSDKMKKKERLHKALDRIADRFGEDAVRHRNI